MLSWGLDPSEFLAWLESILDSTDSGIARGLVLSSVVSLDGLRRGRRKTFWGALRGKWRLLRRSLRRLDCGRNDVPGAAWGSIPCLGVKCAFTSGCI